MHNATPLRVLVIDDDAQVRETLSDIISFLGHVPDPAVSADEGIAKFARDRHEVVVTDLQMPDMDGWEVIQRVRAIEPEIRVVLCTATATNVVVERARLHGIILVRKPVQINELRVALRPRLAGGSEQPARFVGALTGRVGFSGLLALLPDAR
jgi:CheY-like chemotaxis protein